MKCEKCNEKEASFFYTATINGNTTQRHLCHDCAREEGRTFAMDTDAFGMPGGMLGNFFGNSGLLGAGQFGAMIPAIPVPTFLTFWPVQAQAAPAVEASERKIPSDAGAEIRARRELVSLRHKMDEAVKSENFEKAIELRDAIKQLERSQ